MNSFQWKCSRACCMQYTSAERADACTEGFCGFFRGSEVSMFQFPLAVCRIVNGWQVTHRLHTVHTCALYAFLPFPSILPTEIQFQQFWWKCLMNPRFCRMGFSISDLYKRHIGRNKIAFLQYLPSKMLTPSHEPNRICNLTVKSVEHEVSAPHLPLPTLLL